MQYPGYVRHWVRLSMPLTRVRLNVPLMDPAPSFRSVMDFVVNPMILSYIVCT